MMWQVRFARNFAFALMPFPETLRRIKRSVFPYSTAVDPWTVEQGLRQIEMLRASGCNLAGRTVLEIGSGWQPTIPLLLRLAGARKVLMWDSQRLLDERLLAGTARALAERSALIAPRLGTAPDAVAAALRPAVAEGLDGQLEHFGLEYHAPADATATGLRDHSVDVVVSRAVLEHVPPRTIRGIFAESHRVLARDGFACHIIDNSDHWSHVDRGLSAVNFLRYPDWLWPVLCVNPLDYQNRLRHPDYVRMLAAAGFQIVHDPSSPDPVAVAAVRAMRVARRFRRFAPGQLGVITSYLVAVPAP
jgi:SAM-dependent methyltransferase